jgi:hypothetical protein
MLPSGDEEFLLLYFIYGGLFLVLLLGTLFSKKRRRFKKNLLFFLFYTAILTFVFLDEDNFKYGGSLLVLVYGGFFIVLHLAIFICYSIYQASRPRQSLNRK